MSCENYDIYQQVSTTKNIKPRFLNRLLRDQYFRGPVPAYDEMIDSSLYAISERFSGEDALAPLI